MKKILINIIILISIFAFFNYGCKKKTKGDILPEYQYGSISGLQVNNSLFSKTNMTLSVWAKKSNIPNCRSDNYSLVINQKSNTDYYNEKIFIGNLTLDKKGTIQFSETNKLCDSIPYVMMNIGDGDLQWNAFYPLKNQKNTITLSEYNKNTKEISGTFDVTLLVDFGTPKSRSLFPDTVHLYNCQFKVIVND